MKSRWKSAKVWWLLGALLGVMMVGLVGLAGAYLSVSRAGKGKILTLKADIPETTVALVLGARVFDNGVLSPVLADRVDTAIELYKRGAVEKLLMSGDNRTRNYNEVTAMRNYAIRHGVPSDDILRDFAGFRTYDSIYRAREIWDLNELLIVSQQFHLPRSIYIADKLGMKAWGVVAEGRHYPASLSRAKRREKPARLLAWFDVLIGRDPYFLGPKETLSGDSQVTRVSE